MLTPAEYNRPHKHHWIFEFWWHYCAIACCHGDDVIAETLLLFLQAGWLTSQEATRPRSSSVAPLCWSAQPFSLLSSGCAVVASAWTLCCCHLNIWPIRLLMILRENYQSDSLTPKPTQDRCQSNDGFTGSRIFLSSFENQEAKFYLNFFSLRKGSASCVTCLIICPHVWSPRSHDRDGHYFW